jgi:hypothetical protein
MLLFVSLLLLTVFSTSSQVRIQETVEMNDRIIEFETYNGRIDGEFKEYFCEKKGVKQRVLAEGQIKDNYRIGLWKIYHPTNENEVVLELLFTSPFRYERKKFPYEDNNFANFIYQNLNPPLGFDSLNCRILDTITFANIHLFKKIWREIKKENNPLLFTNDVQLHWNRIISDSINIMFTSDNFSSLLEGNREINSNELIVGYKIKEDHIIDKNRLIGEYRILGLAPVVLDSLTGEKRELGWFKYPEIRSELKNVNFQLEKVLTNLDEVLIKRIFSSQIYNTSNKKADLSWNPSIYYVDISLLLLEHNFWLYYSAYLDDYY